MFGVMRLTNTAHGDFIVLLVFVLFALTNWAHVPLWAAVPLLIVIAFGAGYAVQFAVLNRVSGRDPLPSLVVTFGLSIVIQNLLQEVFSADPRSLATGGFESMSFALPAASRSGFCRCSRSPSRSPRRSRCNGSSAARRLAAPFARPPTIARSCS